MPLPSPAARWALTPPFHPCPQAGGLFSVALSLRFGASAPPSPGVTRHRAFAEPGLSSHLQVRGHPAAWHVQDTARSPAGNRLHEATSGHVQFSEFRPREDRPGFGASPSCEDSAAGVRIIRHFGPFSSQKTSCCNSATHNRLLKNPVQRASLRLNRGLAEEKRRTDRGIGATACSPEPHFACPRGFSAAWQAGAEATPRSSREGRNLQNRELTAGMHRFR